MTNQTNQNSFGVGVKVKIVAVGAGGLGKKWIKTISEHPRASLAAIVDVDQEKAPSLAKEYGVSFFDTLENVPTELYSAAIIVVPHNYLAELGKKALSRRKHALIEKPVATNKKDLEELIHLAEEHNVRFMPGYNYRFLGHIKKAKKLIDAGAIGEIMFIRTRHGASGKVGYEKEWRHKKAMGGGVLLDAAVHSLDLARWFMGDFIEMKITAENLFWGSEVEDNAFLLAKTAQNTIASIHASWTHWKPIFSVEIYGKDGYILVDGLTKYMQKERLIVAKRSDDFLGSKVKEEVEEFDSGPDDSLAGELDEFISAITEERDTQPNGKDALAVLGCIDHS